jgi:hypothetical protein
MTKIAGRNDILKLCERRHKDVVIDELGLAFRIQSLTEREKAAYETALIGKAGKISKQRLLDASRRLVCLCLVDKDGKPVMDAGDVDNLANLDGLVVARLYDACRVHCGFDEGDIEGAIKNSEAIHVDDSQ